MSAGRVFFLCVCLSGTFLVAVFWPGPLREDRIVYIPSDMAVRRVAVLLKELGVVRSAPLFESWVRLSGKESRSGEYAIRAGANLQSVVRTLHSGPFFLRRITVPEGLTSRQIVDLINREPFLAGRIDDVPPEGGLWPETYTFQRGEQRSVIVDRMQRAKAERLAELWERRPPSFPLKTPNELLTLASIVEKEAGRGDKAEVANVFLNRLRKNIPLQADASVAYAVSRHKPLGRSLRRIDLKVSDPYNTYLRRGLPPGPICNPGLASIEAVLDSREGQDLYFVLKPEGGGHVFSQSLAEHERHVRNLRAAGGKT